MGRYTFIVNKEAGRGAVRKRLPNLLNRLDKRTEECRVLFTEGPGHATELASGLRKSDDVVVAVGGDGTTHEVACGLVGSMSSLSVLPIGS